MTTIKIRMKIKAGSSIANPSKYIGFFSVNAFKAKIKQEQQAKSFEVF
jgi:hypothetical protein